MKNLRSIRTAQGLSQDGLATLTGLTQPTLSKLEAGTRNPRPATIKLLCLVLGVSRAALYGDASTMANPQTAATGPEDQTA